MPAKNAVLDALTQAAERGFTGSITITAKGRNQSRGEVFLTEGRVYAMRMDGYFPPIAERLQTAATITAAQTTDLCRELGITPRSSQFGPACVERGLVTNDALYAIHQEILLSGITVIASWAKPDVKNKRNRETEEYATAPLAVADLVRAIEQRASYWEQMWQRVTGGIAVAEAVPRRYHTEPQQCPRPELTRVLALSDGTQTLDQIAARCGLTRFETGYLVSVLHEHDLLHVVRAEHATPIVLPAPALDTSAPEVDQTRAVEHEEPQTAIDPDDQEAPQQESDEIEALAPTPPPRADTADPQVQAPPARQAHDTLADLHLVQARLANASAACKLLHAVLSAQPATPETRDGDPLDVLSKTGGAMELADAMSTQAQRAIEAGNVNRDVLQLAEQAQWLVAHAEQAIATLAASAASQPPAPQPARTDAEPDDHHPVGVDETPQPASDESDSLLEAIAELAEEFAANGIE